jgi:signal-transduction protein with cAMP-binding, CBS, and nucleotidyltransferase domain
VAVSIFKDGKVLLIRRGVEPALGKWSVPGGSVELGEALRDAASREVKEETGLDIEVGPVVDTIERLTYDAGQVMFNAGDSADAAYVVIDGTVEISVPTPHGPIVINTMTKNEILGEIAIVGEVPRTATAKAVTRLETLKISKELFIKIIRENPDAAIELIRILAARLASTTSQLTRTRSGQR